MSGPAEDEDRIYWDNRLAVRAWAVRGHPLPAGSTTLPGSQASPGLERIATAASERERFLAMMGHPVVTPFEIPRSLDTAVTACAASNWQAIDPIAAREGVVAALRVLQRARELPDLRSAHVPAGLAMLRSRIARLADDEYGTAAAFGATCSTGTGERSAVFAFLFPTEQWAVGIADRMAFTFPTLLALASTPLVPSADTDLFGSWKRMGSAAVSLVHRFGLDAVPALLAVAPQTMSSIHARAQLFTRIGADATFAVLVSGSGSVAVRRALCHAIRLQPLRAVSLLGEVADLDDPLTRRWLQVVSRTTLEQVPSSVGDSGRSIPLSIPAQPWDAFPAWLASAELPPVERRDGAGHLGRTELRALVAALAASCLAAPHAAVDRIRRATTADSLGRFAWAVFERWCSAGQPPEDGWAFSALGLLGDERTSRRLAVAMLAPQTQDRLLVRGGAVDVLAALDIVANAPYLLCLAELRPEWGTGRRAREWLVQLAGEFGLSADHFADLAVPDLDLGTNGWVDVELDGTTLRASISDDLHPVLRDTEGRSVDAPTDAIADHGEGSYGWHEFEVMAEAAISLQMRRWERAMVTRRRWDRDSFGEVVLGHPLGRKLARLVVWASYVDGEAADSFRVAEDGSLAGMADEPWTMPPKPSLGVAHPLDLGAAVGLWQRVFLDYAILEPFPQLSRSVHSLAVTELGTMSQSWPVPADFDVRHFSRLERCGWRQANPGWPWSEETSVLKPLSAGRAARLAVARTEPRELQLSIEMSRTKDRRSTTFDSLHAVELSELLRDLELLRS